MIHDPGDIVMAHGSRAVPGRWPGPGLGRIGLRPVVKRSFLPREREDIPGASWRQAQRKCTGTSRPASASELQLKAGRRRSGQSPHRLSPLTPFYCPASTPPQPRLRVRRPRRTRAAPGAPLQHIDCVMTPAVPAQQRSSGCLRLRVRLLAATLLFPTNIS